MVAVVGLEMTGVVVALVAHLEDPWAEVGLDQEDLVVQVDQVAWEVQVDLEDLVSQHTVSLVFVICRIIKRRVYFKNYMSVN